MMPMGPVRLLDMNSSACRSRWTWVAWSSKDLRTRESSEITMMPAMKKPAIRRPSGRVFLQVGIAHGAGALMDALLSCSPKSSHARRDAAPPGRGADGSAGGLLNVVICASEAAACTASLPKIAPAVSAAAPSARILANP
jgi:hypothetical protein